MKKVYGPREMSNGERITATAEFSAENGGHVFSLTGEIVDRYGREIAGGCVHDEIARVFPELAPYIKWHLCTTSGPMHYIANTVYHAGGRDHNGRRAGEPWAWDDAVVFGDNPIPHKISGKFVAFLKSCDNFDFEVIRVDHRNHGRYGVYQYSPKYTVGGFGVDWAYCPFDTEQDAFDFVKALQICKPRFVRVPKLFSEGKERSLDAARRTAVWPDATDEELCQEPEALKKALLDRLPALLDEFRRAMRELGLVE